MATFPLCNTVFVCGSAEWVGLAEPPPPPSLQTGLIMSGWWSTLSPSHSGEFVAWVGLHVLELAILQPVVCIACLLRVHCVSTALCTTPTAEAINKKNTHASLLPHVNRDKHNKRSAQTKWLLCWDQHQSDADR